MFNLLYRKDKVWASLIEFFLSFNRGIWVIRNNIVSFQVKSESWGNTSKSCQNWLVSNLRVWVTLRLTKNTWFLLPAKFCFYSTLRINQSYRSVGIMLARRSWCGQKYCYQVQKWDCPTCSPLAPGPQEELISQMCLFFSLLTLLKDVWSPARKDSFSFGNRVPQTPFLGTQGRHVCFDLCFKENNFVWPLKMCLNTSVCICVFLYVCERDREIGEKNGGRYLEDYK